MLDQIETTVLAQCNAVNNLHIYDAKLLSRPKGAADCRLLDTIKKLLAMVDHESIL